MNVQSECERFSTLLYYKFTTSLCPIFKLFFSFFFFKKKKTKQNKKKKKNTLPTSSFATAASKHHLETSSKAILRMSIKGPSHSMNKTQTQVLLAREIGILTAQLTNYKE
jgi:hypothetical protein